MSSQLTQINRIILNKYATILTITSFVIIAVSGVLIFFHIGEQYLKGMHEWIGMAFVIFSILHAIRHLKPVATYFKKRRTHVITALSMVVAAAFIIGAGLGDGKGGHPFGRFAKASTNAPITSIAQVTNIPAETIINRFENAGIKGTGPNQSLKEISSSSGQNVVELYHIMLTE